MSKILKQDTNGTKPLLGVGELGYDNYPSGGDKGRVYVGTGDENIPLAKQSELKQVVAVKDYYAISGQVSKTPRTSFFGFTETTANNLNVSASDWYFKSLNKTVSTIGRSIKFPTAPTGTNLITNGTFDTDTSGWTANNATLVRDTTIFTNGGIKVTAGMEVGASVYQTLVNLTIGKKYRVETQAYAPSSNTNAYASIGLDTSGIKMTHITQRVYDTVIYLTFEFVATTTTQEIYLCVLNPLVAWGNDGDYAVFDNIAVFPATDLLRYDNLMLREDGTYFITQTEQNQYITMDTVLNYTSLLYSVDTGLSTGTSVTMSYDITNEYYNGSDGKKYITVGSTARLNQGTYHPVFNAYGTARYWADNGGTQEDWYGNTTGKDINIASTQYPQVPNVVGATGGASIGYSGFHTAISGRPDSKYYDIIYDELFIDQRWRAEYIDGTKERTTIERDKDISASQYADFVGSATWETKQIGTLTKTSNTIYHSLNDITFECSGEIYDNTELFKHSNIVGYILGSNGNVMGVRNSKIQRILWSWNGSQAYLPCESASQASQFDSLFPNGTQVTLVLGFQSNLRYGSNTFLHTDIIGNPANYPQVWKDALAGGGSIAGTPLLVNDDGTSVINADGKIYYRKASKKVNQILQALDTISSPQNWTNSTVYWNTNFNTTSNSLTNAGDASAYTWLFAYKAYNNNLAPIANSRVIGGSAGVSDVFANNSYDYRYSIGNKLINKIAINEISNAPSILSVKLTSSITDTWNDVYYGKMVFWGLPTHNTILLYGSTSPAAKVFSYLTQGTRAKQCYVFKEMKYDSLNVYTTSVFATTGNLAMVKNGFYYVRTGFTNNNFQGKALQYIGTNGATINFSSSTFDDLAIASDGVTIFALGAGLPSTTWKTYDGNGFGDDNKFNIVDNVSTTTDDNGATILIGQKARLIDGRIKE